TPPDRGPWTGSHDGHDTNSGWPGPSLRALELSDSRLQPGAWQSCEGAAPSEPTVFPEDRPPQKGPAPLRFGAQIHGGVGGSSGLAHKFTGELGEYVGARARGLTRPRTRGEGPKSTPKRLHVHRCRFSAGYGPRTCWQAAFGVQLPRGEAALCLRHPIPR